MFEKKGENLISTRLFARRMTSFAGLAFLPIGVALCIGVVGYHYIAGFSLADSILNASMILAGMGPLGELPSTEAKLFASAYAIFSGLVFISVMGILLTPVMNRILHRFHYDEDSTKTEQ
ncbi:MAG: hypothetical protein JSU83_18045 [Deltaproteobacteria bacterium]|nr:MAG: hypothetical protein JSU83_18045 [Deltaproteobacteria bacterium]